MPRFAYYASPGNFQSVRGDLLTAVTGLPGWARAVVMVLAIPGLILSALSLVALMASMATVLLLTVPTYAILRRLVGLFSNNAGPTQSAEQQTPRPSRRIETTVVEAGPPVTNTQP